MKMPTSSQLRLVSSRPIHSRHATELLDNFGRTRSIVESLESRTMLTVTPNDPLYSRQPWLAQISAPQAWAITTGSSTVVVAVNDSGIDYTHPDLYRNIWLNQQEIP